MSEEKEERVSPISGTAPPAAGKWKPGQSGNPKGRPPTKPFREAMARLREKKPEVDDEIAMAMAARAMAGDVAAANMWADRSDGKVPQSIGGTDELPAIKGLTWLK